MSTCYRFGRVEVRPAERQLLVEGRPAPLGARAFDVLVALIDRRDRVVTKDELLDIVWPGLVVEENNLQVQVSTLRKHLGAQAVATIPGRGYRFTLEPDVADAGSHGASSPGHNLPAQLNRFIGREREIAEVKDLLARSRLVTLTSLGGTGKTRLSLQIAHEVFASFPHGAWFVELAPVSDEARVPQAVASVLGVKEQAGARLVEDLARWVRDRKLLLVLDNCEHLLRATAELVKQLLQAAPGLSVLASSREPLRVSGETIYPLSPLPTPDARLATAADAIAQYDSVRLFVDRATAVSAGFRLTDDNAAAVAAICQRLDGIPFAIELAAARIRALSVESISARLDDCFRLLTSGDKTAPPRQQTLRASLDWSHDLLSPPERVLLRRVAVFAGGWSVEAAEAVCSGGDIEPEAVLDLLAQLVEKSLVDVDAFGERYRLLETVRQYALEKLDESGEWKALRERHFQYYLRLAQEAEPHIVGHDQAAWLKRLDRELENFLAAHATAAGADGLLLVSAIRRYCLNRGLAGLAYRIACDSVARVPERNSARRKALFYAGQMAYFIGRYDEARQYLEQSVAIARDLADTQGEALALQPLGVSCLVLGDIDAAREHLEKGLAMARDSKQDREIAAALSALAQVPRLERDFAAAARLYEEMIECVRRVNDPESVAVGLLNLAMVSVAQPVDARARLVLEALGIGNEVGSRYVGQSALDVCAGLAALAGEDARCARFFGASEAQGLRTGFQRDVADAAFLMPLVDQARARPAEAPFAAEEAAGRALSYEEAIEEARAWLAEVSRSR